MRPNLLKRKLTANVEEREYKWITSKSIHPSIHPLPCCFCYTKPKPMEAKLLHSLVIKPPLPTTLTLTKHSTTVNYPIFSPCRRKQLKFDPISSSSSSSSNTDESRVPDSNSLPRPQITPPPETVEVRFRRRSKRRSRQQRDDDDNGDRRVAKAAEKAPVKKWEDMSAAEKVMELYVGEKGLLFWLNKFAYASIFIVIGGWIFFRFVGPSLNLYQLDSPPLSPDSLFKGSS